MRPAWSTDSGQPRIYKENPLERSLAWAGCLVSLSDHSSPPSKHWDSEVKHCFKDCYVCARLSRCMSTINCRYLQRLEERVCPRIKIVSLIVVLGINSQFLEEK